MGIEAKFEELLGSAEIGIKGEKPDDMLIDGGYTKEVARRCLSQGTLGFCETYMEGMWDCEDIVGLFRKAIRGQLEQKVRENPRMWMSVAGSWLSNTLFNLQTIERARRVAQEHYDLGNTFYSKFLDSSMQYTCANWATADNLEQAQQDKMRILCEKLELEQTHTLAKKKKVLELGCGWGGFARFMAENYRADVTCYNNSREQVMYAREHTPRKLGVRFWEADYRAAKQELEMDRGELFDAVVSVGLIEHVGHKNYSRDFFDTAGFCLKKGGLLVIHHIGKRKPSKLANRFITKHIFPGGEVPAYSQIIRAGERNGFTSHHMENIGHDYARTLHEWRANFLENWDKIKELDPLRLGSKRFKRMFADCYLGACEAGFEEGALQLYQTVFSKGDLGRVYRYPKS